MIASYSLLQSKVTDLPINLKQQFRNECTPYHYRCTSTGCAISRPVLQNLMFQTQPLGGHWQTMGVGKSTVACGAVSDRAFCADERCAQVSPECRHRSSVIAQ